MALQGTLDTFSLPDVLRLLATTSKSGRLRIEGDRGRGSVWLADGGIVDADADRVIEGTPTDEVIFELLRFDSGQFAFDGDDTATAGGDPEEVEAVLRRASSLLSEWTELENVVPSLEHEVCLASDLSADEVTIDADRWRSLVAVASGRTVGELATSLGLTELGVSRAVRELVDLGVADVEAPGTSDRPQAPADARRPSVPHSGDGLGSTRRPAAPTGEPQRAGWLTGETPAVPAEPRPAPASNGRVRASLDDTVVSSTPPPAPSVPPAPAQVPAEPPAKGGFASRLGRSRGASSRGDEATTTGSTPAVPGTTSGPTDRTPAAPPARTNDSGARSRQNGADVAPGSRRSPRSSRPASPEGPGRSVSPANPSRALPPGDRGAPPVAPGGPSRRPSTPPLPSRPPSPSPFDGGRLGPAPASHDTGQIRPVTPSSLPPDLHWAADDTGTGDITGGGTISSPFSSLSSLGPARPAPTDPGEVAPHVAAMSPEARTAVQATVGNAGGSTAGRGAGQGEDIARRGRLISFLSSVR